MSEWDCVIAAELVVAPAAGNDGGIGARTEKTFGEVIGGCVLWDRWKVFRFYEVELI